MAQVKILATLSAQALKEQILGYRILDVQRYLKSQGQTICLELARISGRPRDLAAASFLDLVSTLQGFEPGPGKTWAVTNLHEGDTWRTEEHGDGASHSGPIVPLGSDRLSNEDVGYYRPDEPSRFLLMIHPWGADILVLAQVVNIPTSRIAPRVEGGVQCALCYRFLPPHEANQKPCLFHPGASECPTAGSSDSEMSDDDGTEMYPASSGDSEELDDLAHEELLVYRCCGRRGDEVGCTAETRHMPTRSRHERTWEKGWSFRVG